MTLGTSNDDSLKVGGTGTFSKEIDYTVQRLDLGSATERSVPVRFTLTFVPVDNDGVSLADHHQVTVTSDDFFVEVTKRGAGADNGGAEVEFFPDVEWPDRIVAGAEVTFTLRIRTGKYRLLTQSITLRKQLYDADGDKIGGRTNIGRFFFRALNTGSLSPEEMITYTLQRGDVAAGEVVFSYRHVIEDTDLRDADRTSTDLGSNFEEVFEEEFRLREASRPTATATPTARVTPTPGVTVIGSTSAATVTDGGNYVHVDRHDRGRDFILTLGYLAPNGGRGFNPRGYIRDDDLARGGQTYAVVRRESDNKVVRMWISPESPDRFEVPWGTVNQPPYTVPVSVLSIIPLDETRPVENQLARRFDPGGDGDIYVYRNNAWHWIPDIPTFEAEGFFWCDVTAADADFFNRAYIGRALPRSGTERDPNYPNCHSK